VITVAAVETQSQAEAAGADAESTDAITVTLTAVGGAEWAGAPPAACRFRDALKFLLRSCGLRASWGDGSGEIRTEAAVWTLHFDGLCEPRNPGGVMAWGWVLDAGAGGESTGYGSAPAAPANTNNVAEWYALGHGLAAVKARAIVAHGGGPPDALRIFGDSRLVCNQLNGLFACNAPHLVSLRNRCRLILAEVDPLPGWWQAEWVPRGQNGRADALSRAAYRERTGHEAPERSNAT
jgi:ribonuclease HI